MLDTEGRVSSWNAGAEALQGLLIGRDHGSILPVLYGRGTSGCTLVIKLPEMIAKYEQPSPMTPETVNSLKAQVIASIRQDWAARSSEIMHALPEAGMKFPSAASNLIYVVIVPVLAFFLSQRWRSDPPPYPGDAGRGRVPAAWLRA